MRKLTHGLVLFAGLLAVPSSKDTDLLYAEVAHYDSDPRLDALVKFFGEKHCPIKNLAADFLIAADRNELDWRLLPSISFVESGGGKDFKNNNVLGWDSCRRVFPSVRAGIHHVADMIGTSRVYKYKSTNEILRIYNPRTEYAPLVRNVMRSIGPAEISARASVN
jgi:hypothetical protein